MKRSVTEENFVRVEIGKALSRVGLPFDHPIAKELSESAEVTGVTGRDTDTYVRVSDGCGGWTSNLVERIEQLKADPRFRGSIPSLPKVVRADTESLRANFDQIAKGTMVVSE